MRAGIISRPEVFEEDFLPDVMPFRDSQVKELASRMLTFTVTANTCNLLGSGSKDYKLVYPPVSGDESAFCYPRFGPDKTSGNYLKHDIERMKTLLPKDGFK
jgi:hypothetical protein